MVRVLLQRSSLSSIRRVDFVSGLFRNAIANYPLSNIYRDESMSNASLPRNSGIAEFHGTFLNVQWTRTPGGRDKEEQILTSSTWPRLTSPLGDVQLCPHRAP